MHKRYRTIPTIHMNDERTVNALRLHVHARTTTLSNKRHNIQIVSDLICSIVFCIVNINNS